MALSEEKKELLKLDFEAGELPVTEIAKGHGVSRATIGRLEKKHGWKRSQLSEFRELPRQAQSIRFQESAYPRNSQCNSIPGPMPGAMLRI